MFKHKSDLHPKTWTPTFEVQIMSYSYQFRLKIIKLVTEQDYGIREVAKLHNIPHSAVIYWLKAFRERGLDGNYLIQPFKHRK